jgi:lipopolysaccharide/colanic/teichoic acid biosynthesis glycosyltransferase
LVLPGTYTLRGIARRQLIAAGFYGVPIVIIGNALAARRAITELKAQPDLGYVPVAVFSTQRTEGGERHDFVGVPLVGRAEDAIAFDYGYRVDHAMLALGAGWDDDCDQDLPGQLARRYSFIQTFTKVTGRSLWLARVRAIGTHLSVETSYVRFGWQQRLLKRSLDLTISLFALLLCIPILLGASIAIFIADPGPVLFSQAREGRGGRPIRIYKLRSMVRDAEAKLGRYLAQNEAARLEYERVLKLREDPRVIPYVGAFIRRTSMDELPQLWSVLKGDMSLVGPRVFLASEVALYTPKGRELRREMLPGVTGFWQVEHRENSEVLTRDADDSFYVSNWSIWLDFWIMLRTVGSVLRGSGGS